jgi:hypothetical protein
MISQETGQGIAKVFISYTQESLTHSARALNLSNALRRIGFESDIDQYHSNERWPSWMENRIEWADFVLILCTETYLRRWNGEEKEGIGLGAQWESLLAKQYLYESPIRNDKFIPVVFETTDLKYIPMTLRDVTRIDVGPGLEHLQRLRSRLLGVPPAEMPPISTSLSPIVVAADFFRDAELGNLVSFQPELTGLHAEAESIVSNIFPVSFPQFIYSAKITLKRCSASEFEKRMEKAWIDVGGSGRIPSDYLVDYGTVYTFRDFSQPFWKELFAKKILVAPRTLKSSMLAQSHVPGEKNKFIKLLNRCLRHLCENNGTPYDIEFSRSMKCHLFAAQSGKREGKLKALALKQSAERTVFKARTDPKSHDPKAIKHWQHEAFRHKFMRFGGNWFFILTPFWAFTCDGVNSPSKWHKKSSFNMRKPERNRAVLGHVLFWASVLCKEPDLFEIENGFQIIRPQELQSSPSIKDLDWVQVAKDDEQQEMKIDMEVLL